LPDEFIAELRAGRFAPLLAASASVGLDVQVRENYLSFYHDGLSVLALSEHVASPRYRARIHRKYLEDVSFPDALAPVGEYHRFNATERFTEAYTRHLPTVLSNSQPHAGKEAVVEQKMIRASHCGQSPVVFIDRQVQLHGVRKRADLVGLTAEGQFAITEVKQGLDNRIQHLMAQIHEYYTILAGPEGRLREDVARSYRNVVAQKQSLGLLPGDLRFPDDRVQVTCLLVLYGYNPRSELLARLRQASVAHSLPTALVVVPEGHYTLPPAAACTPRPTAGRNGLAWPRSGGSTSGPISTPSGKTGST
jgi:hypothetical protein